MVWPGRIVFRFDDAVRPIDVHVEAPLLTDWLHARGGAALDVEERIHSAIAADPVESELRVGVSDTDLLCDVLTAHQKEAYEHAALQILRIAVCTADRPG